MNTNGTTTRGMDPAIVAEAVRLKLIAPSETDWYLNPPPTDDEPEPVREPDVEAAPAAAPDLAHQLQAVLAAITELATRDAPPAAGPVQRPYRMIYRVAWTSEDRTLPSWEVFGTLAEAERHARKVARRTAVTRVVIEERLVADWTLFDVVLDEAEPTLDPSVESDQGETTMDTPPEAPEETAEAEEVEP